MKTVSEIFAEINEDNGSNYKMDVLKKYPDHEELKRVLAMTYDRAKYTYGVTMKNVVFNISNYLEDWTLSEALDTLENDFVTRKITGNAAVETIARILAGLTEDNRIIFERILNRDQRINMGRSNINKVFKGLITKPVYMRCGIYNEKTAKKISWPALLQLKADGTYREFTVENGVVTSQSRSGEQYEYPVHFNIMKDFPDGVYIGELTVGDGSGGVLDRSTGNGMINSSEPPHEDIILDLWDYVTLSEYNGAANKVKGITPYRDRYTNLGNILLAQLGPYATQINLIETVEVHTIQEALTKTSEWMTNGFEGSILKDKAAIFRDGTSPQQLKLKLEIDVDVRITGFTDGRKGTKREATFGAISFTTDDGNIQGQTSGFTDKQLEDFNSRREELIGTIMTVQCNDITKGRNNDFYALSHPRFTELRNDKDETDTLERAMEAKESAMGLS